MILKGMLGAWRSTLGRNFFGYEFILTWHWHCFIVKRKRLITNKQTIDYIQSPNLPAANQTKPREEVDKTNPLGAVSYFL